ncbi:uncharacterized protein B0H18DRAFT_933776 [Fomitopsis serialis]|uniref:uncharacterized protein n=1 Tax=Fomitopsis serialis TaxID=139415 RepID=UPI00200745F5|nr:uncharacterized protein B0H18DRAFT_933776 [Neoantrodia serialis]KAH9925280.1 hypothetical protein B0H18DRAFT_933776 [Neoantrodia serialis]
MLRGLQARQGSVACHSVPTTANVPFGVTYEKIGTIQRRLAWPLHKDDTLSRSGRPTGLNIYFGRGSAQRRRLHHLSRCSRRCHAYSDYLLEPACLSDKDILRHEG